MPISYTSRTFNTVLNDINNDPLLVDTPNWWKRMLAGIVDVLSMYENAIANQSFLRTAFTRQAVMDLCALIDYFLLPKQTSSGELLFYLDADSVIFPKTVLFADLAARSQGTIAISSKKFEARAGEVVAAFTEFFTTNFAADNNLDVARVYITGEKVRVSSTVTLPSPLQVNTDYYVIFISSTEIRLATTLTGAYQGTEITLTDDGAGAHSLSLYSFKVDAWQQETKDAVILGESDGVTEWQEFDLLDLDVLKDTLNIVINSIPWTLQETLVESASIDTDYLLRYKKDGASNLMFGDGVYGAIPGNFSINATYATGGGADSNISVADRINVYAGSDSDILGVSNPGTFTGGSNAESTERAKILAPLLLKARNRAVTTEDIEALSLAFGGISIVSVNKNLFGPLSAQVLIVPNGGGLPSGALKTSLQDYLIDRTILESIDIRVQDQTYVPISPTSAVKVLSGFTFAGIKDYLVLAFRLLFSEITQEIIDDYIQNGIASAIVIINTKWSTSFTATDYAQITELLDNVTPAAFGVGLEESSVLGYVDSFVFGVDYLTIAAPAFPIVIDIDEITSENVNPANITEIP